VRPNPLAPFPEREGGDSPPRVGEGLGERSCKEVEKMRRTGNATSRMLIFAFLLVLVGVNAPGLLSQSQIESPEAPRVTYILLPKTRCVVAPASSAR
jgi:hypothetical protein